MLGAILCCYVFASRRNLPFFGNGLDYIASGTHVK